MGEPPSGPARVWRPSLRQECWFLAVAVAACYTAELYYLKMLAADPADGRLTLLRWLPRVIGVIGQAVWITIDRRRRGREIGGWWFGIIFLGPLVAWIYLALEYRARALLLIPLSVVVYGAAVVAPWVVASRLWPGAFA
ncbi:MAG: hypothetical protein HYY17_01890 [Planctomycetes bacterium]|nr:hypothetical protein [Planctomycetota bacterium]